MVETAIAAPKDTRLWLDRLVSSLEEIHESLEDREPNVDFLRAKIENILVEFNETYGKNATERFRRERNRDEGQREP